MLNDAVSPSGPKEALSMLTSAMSYLSAADATQMAAETQAQCLQALERVNAMGTAARASILGAFISGQGYSADADYSPRAWLINKTRITKGAAVAHTAWVRRAVGHPQVAEMLAAGEISESFARTLCQWTEKLPEDCREAADVILVAAAKAGMDLRDLAELAAEILARSRSDADSDPDDGFEDRAVKLETTFQGAGVLTGDLTPECAAVVGTVLDALSAPAGAEDTRTYAQRYHDALEEAMRRLVTSGLLPERAGQPAKVWARVIPRGPDDAGRQLRAAGGVDRSGPGSVGWPPRGSLVRRQRRRRVAGRRRRPRGRVRCVGDPGGNRRGELCRHGGPGPALRRTGQPPPPRCGRRRPGRHRPEPGPATPRGPGLPSSKPSSAKQSSSYPVPAASRPSCGGSSSAPGSADPASRWTSATPRPSRPESATRSSCATTTVSGPGGVTSPRRRARCTTSSTRRTAVRPAFEIVFYFAGSTIKS